MSDGFEPTPTPGSKPESRIPTPGFRGQPAMIVAIGLLALGTVLFLVLSRRPRPRCGPELPSPDSTFFGGDTMYKDELLTGMLVRLGVPKDMANRAEAALAKTDFPFRHLRPGDSVTLAYRGLQLVSLTYHNDMVTSYGVAFDSTGAVATKSTKPVDTVRAVVHGLVKESFWNSLLALGEKPWLAMSFTDILRYDVDFFTESNDGDSFQVIVDKLLVEGRFYRYGRVRAVHYRGKTDNTWGFFYVLPSGHWDYYNEKGQSLRKAILRSPLEFSKVTSHFGMRFHPIYRVYRQHAGVDYGAPSGTPVSAIADGSVTFAGWRGGYGNLVEVRHSGGLSSRYGHLSGFGPGVRSGRTVRQGQTVGYVGTTGDATGPHLHFEIRQAGKPVNPLKVIPPRAEPVPAKYMDEFKQVRDGYIAEIQQALASAVPDMLSTDSAAGR